MKNEKFCGIKRLENGVRDPRIFINEKKILEFKNEIENKENNECIVYIENDKLFLPSSISRPIDYEKLEETLSNEVKTKIRFGSKISLIY